MNMEEQYLELDTKNLKPNPINLQVYGEEGIDFGLVESIAENGQLEPLVVIKDNEVLEDYVIISGHRRWMALKELGKKAICSHVSFKDELEIEEAVIEYNKYRKKTPSQIVNEANLLRSIYAEKAKKRQTDALKQNTVVRNSTQREENERGRTRDKVADAVGIGWEKLNQLTKIKEKADNGDKDAETLMKKLDNEELTVNSAATYFELIESSKSEGPESDYSLKLLDSVHKEKITSNQAIERLKKIRKKIKDIKQSKDENRIDDGPHNVLLADFSDFRFPLEDHLHLQIPFVRPAILCLLTTTPFLKESLDIMDWWGFQYKSMCIWDRDIKDSASWFKGSHEILLLGTRGDWPVPEVENQVPSIISKKKGHECVHKMIQKIFPDQKYIDLLPKKDHEGWDNWILRDEKKLREIKESNLNKLFDNLDKNESIKMIIKSKKKPDSTLDVFEEWY